MKRLKKSDKNLTITDLPKDRKAVFFDIIKMRWGILLLVGVLLFVFSLPYTLNTIFHNYAIDLIFEKIQSQDINLDEGYRGISSLLVAKSLFNIFFLMVIGFAFSGILRILKRLIWAEGIIFWHDFKRGVKDNAFQTIVLFAFIGVFSFVLNYLGMISQLTEGSTKLTYNNFYIISFGIMIIILLPTAGFVLSQIVYYNDNFFVRIKNGLLLYFKTAPKTILFVIVCIVPFLTFIFPQLLLQILGRIFILMFIFPLIILGWLLYSNSVFDQYINKDCFPEIVDKGIWRQ